MRVTRLKHTNLRVIGASEFRFQPGFNLIVGVNGVGKTSVLEALAVCLSGVVRHVNRLRPPAESFLTSDIRVGAQAMTAECGVQIGAVEYLYLIHKSRYASEAHAQKSGSPREQVLDTPDKAEFVGDAPKPASARQPGRHDIGVLFSTRRAAKSERGPSKGAAAGGVAAAYADAFASRELRLSEFAAWMRAQVALKNERPEAARVLEAFESSTRRFLPGYSNIRATEEAQPKLLIDHGEMATLSVDDLSDTERAQLKAALEWADNWIALNWTPQALGPDLTEAELNKAYAAKRATAIAESIARFLPNCDNLRSDERGNENRIIDRKPTTIEVGQLSDGERGTLALVLDLTRRLAQANPSIVDPALGAEGVVLIDEIDLHLHPKWQRRIAQNLIATFPNCQFIATTHSPQVIGEVEHDRIQIVADGQVYSPTHSFGVDSSRVLEEIMESAPRTQEVQDLLTELSRQIGDEKYENARRLFDVLVAKLGEDDPEVTRVRTLLEFIEVRSESHS